MTIAVCVWVPEGIVLASESRQVYKNEIGNSRIASDNAQKVFQLSVKAGGITYGGAFLSGNSILSLVEEWKVSLETSGQNPDQMHVDDIAQNLGAFLNKEWLKQASDASRERPADVGIIVGGYETGVNRIFECSIPGPSIIEISTSQRLKALWKGQTDVITRLVWGFDPRIGRLSWFQPNHVEELQKLNYVIRFDAMTLQDAVDFAIFLIRTTIDMQRFSDGISLDPGDIPGTGGPIDIAVIRPNEGFSWVQKKELKGELRSKKLGVRKM